MKHAIVFLLIAVLFYLHFSTKVEHRANLNTAILGESMENVPVNKGVVVFWTTDDLSSEEAYITVTNDSTYYQHTHMISSGNGATNYPGEIDRVSFVLPAGKYSFYAERKSGEEMVGSVETFEVTEGRCDVIRLRSKTMATYSDSKKDIDNRYTGLALASACSYSLK